LPVSSDFTFVRAVHVLDEQIEKYVYMVYQCFWYLLHGYRSSCIFWPVKNLVSWREDLLCARGVRSNSIGFSSSVSSL